MIYPGSILRDRLLTSGATEIIGYRSADERSKRIKDANLLRFGVITTDVHAKK